MATELPTSPINNTVYKPQGSGPLQDFFLRPLTTPMPHAMPDASNTPIVAQAQELTDTTPIATPPSPVINANAAAGIEPDEDVNQAIASEDAPDGATNPSQEAHANEGVATPPDTSASTKATKPKAKPLCKRKAPGTLSRRSSPRARLKRETKV